MGDTRNGLVGGDYSSKFSPWLAHGNLTARWIYHEVKRYEQERTENTSTYCLIFELLWRDYFRFVALQHGTAIFKPGGVQHKDVPCRHSPADFEAWQNGQTGFPFVDANMRELAKTGFMSNRGRQNVASFLTKDLQIDWRLGAEWFETLLLDHDPCSNYGNWNYAAGVGNDPRQGRHFNVIKQAKTYDPTAEYVHLWVPELRGLDAPQAHVPFKLSSEELARANIKLGSTYPRPVVDRLDGGRLPLKDFHGSKPFSGPGWMKQGQKDHERGADRKRQGRPKEVAMRGMQPTESHILKVLRPMKTQGGTQATLQEANVLASACKGHGLESSLVACQHRLALRFLLNQLTLDCALSIVAMNVCPTV